MRTLRRVSSLVLSFFLLASPVLAQAPAVGAGLAAKKALQHSDYGIWNRLTGQQISADGRLVLYGLTADSLDSRVMIHRLGGGTPTTLERAEGARFSQDGRFVVYRIKPAHSVVAEARAKNTRAADMPTDSMGLVDLQTGQVVLRVERIRNFAMPAKASGWLAYQVNKAPAGGGGGGGGGGGAAAGGGNAGGGNAGNNSERRKEEGYALIVRNLATGAEQRIEDVTQYVFSEDGTRLAYIVSNKEGTGDGVFVLQPATQATSSVLAGKGDYKSLAFDDAGRQIVFLSDRDDFAAKQPSYTVYHWDGSAAEARAIATQGTAGIRNGWWVSSDEAPSFSNSGKRILFGTAPRPAPDPETSAPDAEKVSVDIWTWMDPIPQPAQLLQAADERRRNYQAMFDVQSGKVVQLATLEIPDVTLSNQNDGNVALGRSNLPYRIQSTWGEGGTDYYWVDVNTGAASKLFTNAQGNVSLSTGGKYLSWFDGEKRAWFVMDVASKNTVNVTENIALPMHNLADDHPDLPPSYGSAGWTLNDERFLVYDQYDIWSVDPTGRTAPRNITEGVGRRDKIQLRYTRFAEPEDQRGIDPTKDILLTATNTETMADGFYRDRVNGDAQPVRLLMDDRAFGGPTKAENADVVILTRGTFSEFPDLYVTNPSFSSFTKLSDANPQQAQYRWGTSELVRWRSSYGEELKGVLYKPEGFDPTKKYPMMVYYYELLSNNKNNYVIPDAGGSSINISFYVSRGYLVFTPDITYRDGYPGESAMSSIVPGVLNLIDKGFVDRDRVGMQGHSWGGYQGLYLVTRTNIFKAAEVGAPVVNMISAYGGIRWETGISREGQYEHGQSRIGGSLWEYPMRYIENSPIFTLDKIETPILYMSNDADGAVPWYQGIELIMGMRRLGKPAWMLNYNGEPHGLRKEQNMRDLAVRMQQFFDHYLLDAPPPVWMVRGLPAVDKGKTLGLDLVEGGQTTSAPTSPAPAGAPVGTGTPGGGPN
jgi:dipeptidyl aminopeptidase/acylaminoacyl peptidase